MLLAIKSKIKHMTEDRMEITRPLDASKKRVMQLFSKPLGDLERAKDYMDEALLKFERANRVIAEKTQSQAEADTKTERERLMSLAAECEELGDIDQADEYTARAATMVATFVPSKIPTLPGVVYRDVWRFRITNAHEIRSEFLAPDEVKIGGVVRSMKLSAAAFVGGIHVYCEKIIASRSQP